MRPGWFAALLLAAVALSAVAAGDEVVPGDASVARAVQDALLPQGRRLALATNQLGQATPFAAVLTLAAVVVLLVRRHWPEALLVALTLPLRLVNPGLKALFDSPRPTPDLVPVIEPADGLGFPSGHATGAMLFYGTLIAVAPCLVRSLRAVRLIRLACGLMIVLTGLGRVAVGAHWPTDVLGGYLWGGVMLTVLLTLYRVARPHARERRSA